MRANALPNHNECLAELAELLGDRFSTGEAVREQHAHDESWHQINKSSSRCDANQAGDCTTASA